jgi:hypothetical protein
MLMDGFNPDVRRSHGTGSGSSVPLAPRLDSYYQPITGVWRIRDHVDKSSLVGVLGAGPAAGHNRADLVALCCQEDEVARLTVSILAPSQELIICQ